MTSSSSCEGHKPGLLTETGQCPWAPSDEGCAPCWLPGPHWETVGSPAQASHNPLMQVPKDVWGLAGWCWKKKVSAILSSAVPTSQEIVLLRPTKRLYLCARSRAYREGCFHLGGFLTWGGQDSGVGGPTRAGRNSGMSGTNQDRCYPGHGCREPASRCDAEG